MVGHVLQRPSAPWVEVFEKVVQKEEKEECRKLKTVPQDFPNSKIKVSSISLQG